MNWNTVKTWLGWGCDLQHLSGSAAWVLRWLETHVPGLVPLGPAEGTSGAKMIGCDWLESWAARESEETAGWALKCWHWLVMSALGKEKLLLLCDLRSQRWMYYPWTESTWKRSDSMDWGWGWGRRVLVNQLTLPQQRDAVTIRKKARILPSFQHEQAQSPWPQSGSGSNRRDRRALGTSPPNIPVKCSNEGLTPSRTRNSSAPLGSESSTGCLGPFGDPELQQLTSLDTKQPVQCAQQTLLPRAGWPCLFTVCFPNAWDERAYTRLQVQNPELSPSRALNTLVWARLLFGLVVLFCISFIKPLTRCKTRRL